MSVLDRDCERDYNDIDKYNFRQFFLCSKEALSYIEYFTVGGKT